MERKLIYEYYDQKTGSKVYEEVVWTNRYWNTDENISEKIRKEIKKYREEWENWKKEKEKGEREKRKKELENELKWVKQYYRNSKKMDRNLHRKNT